MSDIAAIVEGHGEVAALPILLRRLSEWITPEVHVNVPTPIRVHRNRFLNRDVEFSRMLALAAGKCGDDGWILILLDADDDCPVELGSRILARAKDCVPHRRISVVLPNREYEAWFIASAVSLDGFRGFSIDQLGVVNAEVPRDAKGWIGRQMNGRSYSETTDQVAFSARMNLQQASVGSRSFRKLCSEWQKQVGLGIGYG